MTRFIADVEAYLEYEIRNHFKGIPLPDFKIIILYPRERCDPLNWTRYVIIKWEMHIEGNKWTTTHSLEINQYPELTVKEAVPIVLPWAERVFSVL